MYISPSSGGAALNAVSKLQKMPDGEYTAGSVAMNQNEAISKFLMRLQDGNYVALNSPLARSKASVQAALLDLNLGG